MTIKQHRVKCRETINIFAFLLPPAKVHLYFRITEELEEEIAIPSASHHRNHPMSTLLARSEIGQMFSEF
jgi:hypothetical protein